MKRLVKNKFNVDAARAFINTVRFDTPYYVFAANPGSPRRIISTPLDSRESEVSLYNSMLFGRRIKFDDVRLCAKRYDWVFGTVYDMYDDLEDLNDRAYYVTTNVGVDLNVYKCLFNNNGARSTVEPFGTPEQPFETMEDGYVWKYMFTINSFDAQRFANRNQIPVSEQPDIIQAATPGSIDIIKVENKGLLYNNYTVGSFAVISDIRVGGNPLEYALAGNASVVDGFYRNCLIRINSNTQANGQFRLITGYRVIGGRKIITLDRPFDITPEPADGYEIYPNVFIYDTSDSSTEACVARAIIDPQQANSVSRIEILNTGKNYRSARAELIPDASVDITNETKAELRVIIGPSGGHGSDPFNELGAYFVGISTAFVGNTVPLIANNSFNTIGIVKQPLFNDCTLSLDSESIRGEFLPNEKIFRFRPIKLAGKVEVFANSIVQGTDTDFVAALRENDRVLITSPVGQLFANTQVLGNQLLKLDIPPLFEASNCEIYLSTSEYFAESVEFDAPRLKLRNVVPTGFAISQYIFGETSQAWAKTSNTMPYLTIGSRPSNEFSAFNQVIRLEGVKLSTRDEFNQNEEVIQNLFADRPANPVALVHSFEKGQDSQLDSLYVTNEVNKILQGGTITTNRRDSSQVNFEIVNKYEGELVKDSGDILYVENLNTITRNNEQTETIKLYLEF